MPHVLLTPCSRRKRGLPEEYLRASSLPPGPINGLAVEWTRRLHSARTDMPASEYYVGRGPAEAKAAVAQVSAKLVFVSAGLGFVGASESVPHYSLTVGPSDPDDIGQRVEGAFSPQAWWAALRRAQGKDGGQLSDICLGSTGCLVVALPGTYLRMIGAELAALPSSLLMRIRIVGAACKAAPPSLTELWMPYDARFDGPDAPNPGTRGDFAQRAARHFFEYVLGRNPDAAASEHAAMVQRCLSGLTPPVKLSRRPGSDAELIGAISRLLVRTGGRSGQTLTLLRREAGWACEQGRFRRLFAAATGRRSEP